MPEAESSKDNGVISVFDCFYAIRTEPLNNVFVFEQITCESGHRFGILIQKVGFNWRSTSRPHQHEHYYHVSILELGHDPECATNMIPSLMFPKNWKCNLGTALEPGEILLGSSQRPDITAIASQNFILQVPTNASVLQHISQEIEEALRQPQVSAETLERILNQLPSISQRKKSLLQIVDRVLRSPDTLPARFISLISTPLREMHIICQENEALTIQGNGILDIKCEGTIHLQCSNPSRTFKIFDHAGNLTTDIPNISYTASGLRIITFGPYKKNVEIRGSFQGSDFTIEMVANDTSMILRPQKGTCSALLLGDGRYSHEGEVYKAGDWNGKGYEHLISNWRGIVDLASSIPAAAVALPLMGIIALCIRIENKGPVFFKHKRVGKDGRIFELLKFTSLEPGSDIGSATLEIAQGIKGYEDPRATRVGRILRRNNLDELPQLLQIIWGTLSAFGTRPMAPYAIEYLEKNWPPERFKRWLKAYNSATLGVSGTTQLFGTPLKEEKARFHTDMFGGRNASLNFDLYMIWRTLCEMTGLLD